MDYEALKQKIRNEMEPLPLHQYLGIRITEVGDGTSQVILPIQPHILNMHGAVHGGIYYNLCDIAAYAAALTILSDESLAVTSNISISVLNTASEGTLWARAETIKQGKRLLVHQSRIYDDRGTLLALGQVTKTVLPRK